MPPSKGAVRFNPEAGVKHLNPRQGITTSPPKVFQHAGLLVRVCETPKSPPGDYNADEVKLVACIGNEDV